MSLENLENEIHVWFCSPEDVTDSSKLDYYHSILSSDEQQRQQSFRLARDQHSYLVSHALSRTVLSSYCDILPQQWLFDINDHGKPEIATAIDCPPLRINLSHTDGLVMCAVTLYYDCGIDVENLQRKNRLLSVAERMFASQELQTLRTLDDAAMRLKFFDYWTLRESYVKALGTGLSGSSKQFYFEVMDSTEAQRDAEICFDDSLKKKDQQHVDWQFTLLTPSAEHTAAVACAVPSGRSKRTILSRQITP